MKLEIQKEYQEALQIACIQCGFTVHFNEAVKEELKPEMVNAYIYNGKDEPNNKMGFYIGMAFQLEINKILARETEVMKSAWRPS